MSATKTTNHSGIMSTNEAFYINRIAKAKRLRKGLPEGSLQICKNSKNSYKWRVSKKNRSTGRKVRKYIKKSNEKQASDLAWRTYLDNLIEEDSKEVAAIRTFRKNHIEEPHGMNGVNCPEEFCRLLSNNLGKLTVEWDAECTEWVNAPYEHYEDYENHLRCNTSFGLTVRSKSEVDVAEVLYEMHIPFRYEECMIIDGEPIAPDFKLMHPITHKIFIWEHFGGMDDLAYIERHRDKLYHYAKDGWIMDINLIVTTETYKHPFNKEQAKRKLFQFFDYLVV